MNLAESVVNVAAATAAGAQDDMMQPMSIIPTIMASAYSSEAIEFSCGTKASEQGSSRSRFYLCADL